MVIKELVKFNPKKKQVKEKKSEEVRFPEAFHDGNTICSMCVRHHSMWVTKSCLQ